MSNDCGYHQAVKRLLGLYTGTALLENDERIKKASDDGWFLLVSAGETINIGEASVEPGKGICEIGLPLKTRALKLVPLVLRP